jgi:hypothetical protein
MKATPRRIEQAVYLFIIFLALAILVMVAIAPADFLNTGAVYRGF